MLANVAPAVLAGCSGAHPTQTPAEGSQLKVNMLLRRLPRLRDAGGRPGATRSPARSTSTRATSSSSARTRRRRPGRIPTLPPCEIYCHSLTDPSILGPELRAAGAQTLTLFGLHMPARLFARTRRQCARRRGGRARRCARSTRCSPSRSRTACARRPTATVPRGADPGRARGRAARMPGGHIFHRDLSWPFAESERRGRPLGRRDRATPTSGSAAPARGAAAASAGSRAQRGPGRAAALRR